MKFLHTSHLPLYQPQTPLDPTPGPGRDRGILVCFPPAGSVGPGRAPLPHRCYGTGWADSPALVPDGARHCHTHTHTHTHTPWPGPAGPSSLLGRTSPFSCTPKPRRLLWVTPVQPMHLACYFHCHRGFQSLWDTPAAPGLPNCSTKEHTYPNKI